MLDKFRLWAIPIAFAITTILFAVFFGWLIVAEQGEYDEDFAYSLPIEESAGLEVAK